MWFNPRCSKCRGARDLLEGRDDVSCELVHYLDDAPSRADIERVMSMLGVETPRDMMRVGEPIYAELGLADADRDELIDAMVEHPILIERPIAIVGDRAVIGRPPEKVLELLE
jgi:arsenate reductase (glutaredoxin)